MRGAPGRVRTRPDRVLADKAFTRRSIREQRRRGIRAMIPEPVDRASNRLARGSKGGRPPAFDLTAYRGRNTAERYINRLKQWRGLITCYDKTAQAYLGAVTIASIVVWLRTE